ncbi:MAG: hypothetical protein IJU36_09460 [Paludibacteraceae bacterium]|nr:hypothetical protein [Paludibacteraceae bacterium]
MQSAQNDGKERNSEKSTENICIYQKKAVLLHAFFRRKVWYASNQTDEKQKV